MRTTAAPKITKAIVSPFILHASCCYKSKNNRRGVAAFGTAFRRVVCAESRLIDGTTAEFECADYH